jgi:hypothetical protein
MCGQFKTTALQNEIGFNYFWIRGSSYRGPIYENDVYAAKTSQRIDPNITSYDICRYFQINGNVIYNLGDNQLAKIYFEEMSPIYARKFRKKRTEWYDMVACYYLYEMQAKFSTRIVHYFVFSDFIQNENMVGVVKLTNLTLLIVFLEFFLLIFSSHLVKFSYLLT